MKIAQVVERLKMHCPSLGGRVIGTAFMMPLEEKTKLNNYPAAYVMISPDKPDAPNVGTGYTQKVNDTFVVYTVWDAGDDEADAGVMLPVDMAQDFRDEIIRCLVGWSPDKDYFAPLSYAGGMDIEMVNRAHVYVSFEFETDCVIGWEDTALNPDAMPIYKGMDVDVDMIDPAADAYQAKENHPDDPDAYQGAKPGPDGRIEHKLKFNQD